ncbi:cysteine synthase A [Pseudactinotalea sp. Z1732]|uniref:cysteine synthase A n=1 Tax=Pseudactinotalea sp. Z1732 TaxID=3413026 RepID=UPI003C7E0364
MARIYADLTELVGHTPLVRVGALSAEHLHARVLVKLESQNPGFSVKDRTALAIVRAAEADGRLRPGGTILEATSGNTGIAFAWIGAVLGYRVVIVMPDDVSSERAAVLRALGAEVIFTPGTEGMAGANQHANAMVEADPDLFLSGQGGNPANPHVHETTTGPEIWADTDGQVDVLVATTGTGGTISGAGRYLRTKNPRVQLFGVEPAEAAVLNGQEWHPHKIQGITGGNGVPPVTDLDLLDGVLQVPQDEAIEVARTAFRTEGLIVGVSSGAALHAALQLARREEYAGRTIVAILPDTGERYISSELFDHVRR